MIDNSKEYIVCAAVERIKPRECISDPYKGECNDILKIEIGYRHHDIYSRFNNENILKQTQGSHGFYTSKGRFVKRREGMKIAHECGQVTDEKIVFKNNNKEFHINVISYREETEEETNDNEIGFNEYNPLFSEDLY